MKKLIILLLVLTLILPASGSLVFAQESSDINQLIFLIKELEIMSGDEHGFRIDDTVTRAEFAKIAMCTSEFRDAVSKSSITSPFHDVPFTYWGASYIRAAANNGYIKGYPDSTFLPENNVTLEEGVTIVLKLLGYGDDYFDLAWPDGQMNTASKLELLDGVSASIGDDLTRGDVVRLIYNALTTNIKGTTSTLLNSFGYQYMEDTVLIATSNEDSSVSGNKIVTSAGTFEIAEDFDKSLCGYKGELIVKDQTKVVSFYPSNVRGTNYILNTVFNDDILVYSGTQSTKITIDENTPVYYKSAKTTFDATKANLSMGDSILFYTNGAGNTEYVVIESSTMTGPVTVLSSLSNYGINDKTIIYKNGKAISHSDVKANDILYYSEAVNMAWVYQNKITGVFESASPNQDNVESVVISGKSYNLESAAAYEKFVTGGTFTLGDTVTVYLGRNGEIADASSASANESMQLKGYLIATGTKQYQNAQGNNYSSYYATVAFADGTEVEYKTEKNYKDYVSSLVNITFEESSVKLTTIPLGNNTLEGEFNAGLNLLGNAKLANDVKIMDIANTDVSSFPSYTTVYKQRLDGVSLSAKQIFAYEKNSLGEISVLYLNNATGDCYDFGIVNNISGNSYSLSLSNSSLTISGGSTQYPISKGNAVKALLSGNSASTIQRLTEVPEKFTDANATTLIFEDEEYKVYDKIAVFERVATGQWQSLSYADFLSGEKPKTVRAYYDKLESKGGRIRVLVITR